MLLFLFSIYNEFCLRKWKFVGRWISIERNESSGEWAKTKVKQQRDIFKQLMKEWQRLELQVLTFFDPPHSQLFSLCLISFSFSRVYKHQPASQVGFLNSSDSQTRMEEKRRMRENKIKKKKMKLRKRERSWTYTNNNSWRSSDSPFVKLNA